MTVFLHGASRSQVWQTDAKHHMSQQCFIASVKVVRLHWWALRSLCFYSLSAAQIISVKHREKHKDYLYLCYMHRCLFVCCTVCMLVHVCVNHCCVGGQKMGQINLWGCASGSPTTACMSSHMGSPPLSCLSFEWLLVNVVFCFVWECLEFDQSHKSIQSHLCMLTL